MPFGKIPTLADCSMHYILSKNFLLHFLNKLKKVHITLFMMSRILCSFFLLLPTSRKMLQCLTSSHSKVVNNFSGYVYVAQIFSKDLKNFSIFKSLSKAFLHDDIDKD